MSERMTDDRILGYERIWNTLCSRERELLQALKAERGKVAELEARLAEYETDEPDIEPFKPKTTYTLKGKLLEKE